MGRSFLPYALQPWAYCAALVCLSAQS
jgi:hypothetical protein